MMVRTGKIILCIQILSLLLFGQPSQAVDIVIGSIKEDPKEEVELFMPLADYLANHLREYGVEKGRVVVTRSMDDMAELLKTGVVDLYFDSPYPILYVSKLSGGRMFLRRWKAGVSEYHSVVFVRNDSSIRTLNDLKGHVIAFEEPWSSSSYFLPMHSMVREGLVLTELSDIRSLPEPDEIGYIFSYSDRNTMYWVLENQIAAGAMSETKLTKHAHDRLDEVRLIHSTFSIPRQVVMHRNDLDQGIVEAIGRILTTMHENEEGQSLLDQFEQTLKFDQLPDQSLDRLINGMSLVNPNGS